MFLAGALGFVLSQAAADGAATALRPSVEASGEGFSASDATVHLLQTRSSHLQAQASQPKGSVGREAGVPEVQALLRPVSWLHVPKCGSSFEAVLINNRELCPNTPKDEDVEVGPTLSPKDEDVEVVVIRGHGLHYEVRGQRINQSMDDLCPGSFTKYARGGHEGLGDGDYEERWKGRGMTVLRQPEQRVISAYLDTQHSWPFPLRLASSPLEYAQVVQGCGVRMMTRGNSRVATAVRRLREGFVFVGIVERWSLSVCLFHRKFGGRCHKPEFVNNRPAVAKGHVKLHPGDVADANGTHYNVESWLGHFKDRYDRELYRAGVELFLEDLKRYKVSGETCAPCFREAGVEVAHADLVYPELPPL